jgi:16S rRNA (cytosine967-C5)-methyltransferase
VNPVKITPSHVHHLQKLLGELLLFASPADQAVSRYFREHKNLGVRDRGIVAEAAYAVLRNKLSLGHLAESGSGPLQRRLAVLGLLDQFGVDPVVAAVNPDEKSWVARIAQARLGPKLLANCPDWLWERLVAQLGHEEAQQLTLVLNRPAPLDVRVNSLKLSREEALARLADEGFASEPCRLAPQGLRLEGKPALQHSKLMQDGGIEVQDEGSQLLAYLTAPKRGELVVDFCAGAGGKTLALGALMRNTGRLYALDVSERRLAKLKPRLARSGLSNVHPVVIAHEKDAKLKRMAGKADRVLVDAPCSGLGTARRNPDLKWRQTPATVQEMTAKQGAILDAAMRLVKPGGVLVYATCSLLREENEAIVEAFLARHAGEWALVPAADELRRHEIALPVAPDGAQGPYLRLWPHRDQTDGFFAARLERRAT